LLIYEEAVKALIQKSLYSEYSIKHGCGKGVHSLKEMCYISNSPFTFWNDKVH